MRAFWLIAMAGLAGCRHPDTAATTRAEAARLRASVERFAEEYRGSIEVENRLISETAVWLKGDAITAPRTQALADSRRWMDRWGRVYFVPRYMHEQLRLEEYSSGRVRGIHRQLLDILKRRYFELHDYQRYAQRASETEMHHTPAGRLAAELLEFRSRLEARTAAADEIRPLLGLLACLSGAAEIGANSCK